MRPRRFLACCVLGVLPACHAAPPATTAKASIAWPAPPGWKSETIPFPLEFARDVDHRGFEEVRFAPSFFDPKAETYFTYSFAWVLDDARMPTPDELAADMRRYFFGLARAVGKEKHAAYEESAFGARVEAVDGAHSRGAVRMIDAFGDGRALVLNLDAESTTCAGRKVLLVSLSPHPPGDATWAMLLEQRRTFRCLAP